MLDGPRREELQRLRAEIESLKDGPVCGDQWKKWYQAVCRLLKDAYGLESKEFTGFHEIRFEAGKMMQDAGRKIESLLPNIPIQTMGEDHYYRERLSEADEYLLALLIGSPAP
jgi:hypothetical protein